MNYTQALKKKLLRAGGLFYRQGKGDHEIWQMPNGVKITLDVNGKSRHTANDVLKKAGLPKAF